MLRRPQQFLIPVAFAIIAALLPFKADRASAESLARPDLPLDTFAQCFAQGREIVLVPKIECVAHYEGLDRVKSVLDRVEPDEVCQLNSHPRRLPFDAIKSIAAYGNKLLADRNASGIWPMGIRILGAVFCADNPVHDIDQLGGHIALDLAGLDLPYSLIIDFSIFNGIIDARNLRVKGDFSFDSARIADRLNLNRARVDGSVYGESSIMKKLAVNDTTVNGTWWLQKGVVFGAAEFRQAHITGDLNLEETAFGQLLLQSSSVAGTLNVNKSEVRCSYYVSASNLGFLSANMAGFGIIETSDAAGRGTLNYPWWKVADPSRKSLFETPIGKTIADKERSAIAGPASETATAVTGSTSSSQNVSQETPKYLLGCKNLARGENLEFSIIDSTVQAALCLTSFKWAPKNIRPVGEQPPQVISLNRTKIGGNLIIDVIDGTLTSNQKPAQNGPDYDRLSKNHLLQAVNLSAGALINNFSSGSYFTYLDDVRFYQVHKAKDSQCTSPSGLSPAVNIEPPSVEDVLGWLERNEARSSQPFAAFVEAFTRAGEDTTKLRIKRQTIDVCKASPWWVRKIALPCRDLQFDTPAADAIAGTGADFITVSSEFATVSFRWMLFLLADHGLRPGKVLWSVLVALVLFVALFWFGLRVVGYQSKGNDEKTPAGSSPIIWPSISLLFIFDRLIPLYQIRKEHYEITKVYRKATRAEIKQGPKAAGDPPFPMSCYGLKLSVWPADNAKLAQFESWLVVLRIIGVVLTVFLLAAIKTLGAE